jgi:hypothetical protein
MEKQNYQNHSTLRSPKTKSQIVYYASVSALNVLAIVNLCRALIIASGRMNAVLFLLTAISLLAAYFLFRSYAVKVQDRAIRAEENLRHFVLTGKLLDKNLHIKQIVALRFAPDEEFLNLTERAVKEKLSNKEIKGSIKNWKEDLHRA